MRDALTVYRRLVRLGAKPALTWYGADGRIELSGKVAANHLAKIAGYLLDEVWLEPGATVLLDLPAHWKQVLWGLGALLAGGTVACGARDLRGSGWRALVTDDPRPDGAEDVLALDLGPLATSWGGEPLPPGVRDAIAEAMGSPDALVDETAHESSNASEWCLLAERLGHGPPLSAPAPEEALAAAVRFLGSERLLVADDPGEIERIRIAERL